MSSNWEMFQSAGRTSGTGLSFHLFISVSGPGTMKLTFSDSLLFSVERGRTAQRSLNVLKFGPVYEFFKEPIAAALAQAFPKRIDQNDKDPEFDKFFEISYGGEYLRIITRILKVAEQFGHGGAVVIIRESGANQLNQFVSLKYPVATLHLWTDLVTYLAAICDEIEARKLIDQGDSVSKHGLDKWRTASSQVENLNQRLIDQSRYIARLTQVDGALFLTDRLRVLGFGGVISDLQSRSAAVRSCQDERGRHYDSIPAESYGTRHRSSFGLCGAIESVAFVMSQDGGVKAIRSHEGNVLFWPSVTLSPHAWFPTADDMISDMEERQNQRMNDTPSQKHD